MKNFKLLIAVSAGLALSISATQAAITFGFAADSGSTLNFGVNSFNLSPTGLGGQWFINGVSGGTGSALNLQGTINPNSGTAFNYSGISISGGTQTATVTGPLGTLTIGDGLGNFLTGTIDWLQIATTGASGSANGSASIDVTGLSYTGPNADLSQFIVGNGGVAVLTFSFGSTETLTQLSAGGIQALSYSGTLTSATLPEPKTIVAGALMLLPLGIGAIRSLRKERALN